MANKVPVVRQMAWISAIPQLAFMGLLIFFWWLVNPKEAILYGAINYLIISISLRSFVASSHRKGMRLMKSEKFEESISHFEASYAFFTKHTWLDKYRFITLLSSSKMTYKAMALNNIAFAYGQMGNIEESKAKYEQLLQEYPENAMATVALRMINARLEEEE